VAPRPGKDGAPKHKSVGNGSAVEPQDKVAPTIPSSALIQYGSNLLGKGDIFPIRLCSPRRRARLRRKMLQCTRRGTNRPCPRRC
jgi:hypothetical protein